MANIPHFTKYGEYVAAKHSKRKKVVLVNWNSKEGKNLLAKSEYNRFYDLANHYQQQINPFYCGVASGCTVLNALRAEHRSIPNLAGRKDSKVTYHLYNQINILNNDTDKIKPKEKIAPKNPTINCCPGLHLSELKDILDLYGTEVKLRRAEKPEKAGIKNFVKT